MRMEDTEVSRRRVSMIAAHFAANDDVSAMATHVLPVVRGLPLYLHYKL